MNILTYDIESRPQLAEVWGLWDQNIGLNQVQRHTTILSISWKAYGSDEVIYDDCFDDGLDDRRMLEHFWHVLDQTDVAIGQNLRKFDNRRVSARMMQLGMPPHKPFRTLDTLVMAKRTGMFDSNKLEHLSATLTAGKKSLHSEFPGHSLWSEFCRGNKRARTAMREYNEQDVRSTEDLYRTLAPWDRGHMVVQQDSGCPRCGGELERTDRFTYTATGRPQTLMRCRACKGWSKLARADKSTAPVKPLRAA